VRSDSRAQDLLYQYDALSRFGDAHHGGPAGAQRAEEVRNYIELRPLGRALMSRSLRVVLIDEIDKAPRDLPNPS
jgi:MoxR-like ATPase